MSVPLTIERLSHDKLAKYLRLGELVALINKSFVTSWHTIEGLVGDDVARYETTEQFVDDMGHIGAIWIAFDGNADVGRMVATAAWKPWSDYWKTSKMLKANDSKDPSLPPHKDELIVATDKIELTAVCVEPSMQKLGLGLRLCEEVEQELKQIAQEAGRNTVHLMIRTGKENNEKYWTKKGYKQVGETQFEKGDFGSKTGFIILDMEKLLPV